MKLVLLPLLDWGSCRFARPGVPSRFVAVGVSTVMIACRWSCASCCLRRYEVAFSYRRATSPSLATVLERFRSECWQSICGSTIECVATIQGGFYTAPWVRVRGWKVAFLYVNALSERSLSLLKQVAGMLRAKSYRSFAIKFHISIDAWSSRRLQNRKAAGRSGWVICQFCRSIIERDGRE
jgi:hypothetical protein